MPAVWLGQQRSEAVGPGSNLCRARYFYDFTDIYDFTQQNVDTPLSLTQKFFSTRNLMETGGFPYQVFRFGPVRQNFFRQYSDAPPPLLCMKFFDTKIFLKQGFPYEFFRHRETKKSFNRK